MSSESNITKKMQQLRELVDWFESDEFSLEAASKKFEAANKLASEIETELTNVKNKVTVLKEKFDA